MLKFRMEVDPTRVFDLTRLEVADSVGYQMGMTRTQVREKVLPNLPWGAFDAIRFPSEQDPGGINYPVLDPAISKFEGAWTGEVE